MSILKKQNLKNNFVYNFIYQIVILVIPLFVSPYLTRTLGETSLGEYTFVYTIAYYFIVAANLGIAKYGQRIISQRRDDREALRKTFWSLYLLHLLISLAIFGLYIGFCFVFAKHSITLFFIEAIYVASALFDITWLFYGLENFKQVVIRNLIIKIIECVLIFTIVKTETDIWKYALITSSGILLSQIMLIPSAFFSIRPIKFGSSNLKEHVKPLFLFAISVVAVSLYTVFDETLLGIMTDVSNVAFYEYANRIVILPRTFVTIICTVSFPRACKLVADGNKEETLNLYRTSILVVVFVGIASLFGLLGIGEKFAVIYYGESFRCSGQIIQAMSSLPLIIGVGEVFRTHFLIPKKQDNIYIICSVINAVVNIAISAIAIPFLGVFGAVIGTCSAEMVGLIIQWVACRKDIDFKYTFRSLCVFTIIGAIMYAAIKLIDSFANGQDVVFLIIEVFAGAFIYCLLAFIYFLIFDKKQLATILASLRKKH